MIKNVLQEIGGVGSYAIMSLCLFFTVFTTAFIWALMRGKKFCAAMSALPLENDCELAKGKTDL